MFTNRKSLRKKFKLICNKKTFVMIVFLIGSCNNFSYLNTDIKITYNSLPKYPLFVLSVVDSCVMVIDVQTKKLIGTIQSSEFNKTTDIEVTSSGLLYLPLHGDAEGFYKKMLIIDPSKGSIVKWLSVPYVPTTIGISSSDILFVGHNLDKLVRGCYDLSIVDAKTHKLIKQLEVKGYVNDIDFKGKIAYIALGATSENVQHGILVYDIKKYKQIGFYALPYEPISIAIDRVSSNLYATLFIPDKNSPCGERGEIIKLNMKKNNVKKIKNISSPGPIVLTDNGNLITGDYCEEVAGYLSLINPNTGKIIKRRLIGKGINDICKVSHGIIAVTVLNESTVIFFDMLNLNEINKISLPCKWPEAMAISKESF